MGSTILKALAEAVDGGNVDSTGFSDIIRAVAGHKQAGNLPPGRRKAGFNVLSPRIRETVPKNSIVSQPLSPAVQGGEGLPYRLAEFQHGGASFPPGELLDLLETFGGVKELLLGRLDPGKSAVHVFPNQVCSHDLELKSLGLVRFKDDQLKANGIVDFNIPGDLVATFNCRQFDGS
jgi:hypothetical protein